MKDTFCASVFSIQRALSRLTIFHATHRICLMMYLPSPSLQK